MKIQTIAELIRYCSYSRRFHKREDTRNFFIESKSLAAHGQFGLGGDCPPRMWFNLCQTECLENIKYCAVSFMDEPKSFGCVSRRILVNKVRFCNTVNYRYSLIKYFLENQCSVKNSVMIALVIRHHKVLDLVPFSS